MLAPRARARARRTHMLILTLSLVCFPSLAHTHAHIHTLQALLDRLMGSGILTAYERDYELDKLTWYYDEMGGGVEGKRKKNMGSKPVAGQHYRPCTVTTGACTLNDIMSNGTAHANIVICICVRNAGDSQDVFHTSIGVFANNHALDKPFVIQSANTVNHNNALNLPDTWSCGATSKGSMTVELFMSSCVHRVENNLKPKIMERAAKIRS